MTQTILGRHKTARRGNALLLLKITAIALTLAVLLGAVSLPVFGAVITVKNSLMPVLSLEVSRQDQAVIGEEFSIVYLVKNISDKPAYAVDYKFNVMGERDDFPFSIAKKPEPIDYLEPGASATINIRFKVDSTARESSYRINGMVTCVDIIGENPITYSAISEVSVNFNMIRPNLLVTALTVLENNPDPKVGFTIRLELKNSSLMYDMRNISVQLEGGEAFEIMEFTNRKQITRIAEYQSASVEFKLRAREDRKTNSVTLITSFDYSQGSAEEKREELFLPVKEEDKDKTTNEGIPRVIIKRYTLSKEQVLAGDRIDLTVEIENTNKKPVKNVLINFGVESTSSETGGGSSSTVFAPVGSSNTFYVDEIKGKSTITNTITFAVDSGAIARTYIVPVTISYEDEKGEHNNLRTSDNVNIPVTQQAKLSITSMTLPSSGMLGMPTPVMAEFINSGKVDLADFSVRIEGDFDLMDATFYMPKLMIGAITSYNGMLIPTSEGDKEGKLIVSYSDINNTTVTEEFPFTVNVSAMEDMGFPGDDMYRPDGGMFPEDGGGEAFYIRFIKTRWIELGLGLLVLIQFIIILRMRKKAREEFFDE